jgi:nicotinamidase-related amidase
MAQQAADGTAVLVVDMQNAVVAEAHEGDALVARVAGIIDRARDEGVPVLYVRHQEAEYAPMNEGADGWQIRPEIAPHGGETIIDKRFNDAFAQTDLAQRLAEIGATRLVVMGCATDACISATVFRAMTDGYDVTLVADGHGTGVGPWSPEGLTAPMLIAQYNAMFGGLSFPNPNGDGGHAVNVVPSNELTLRAS